MERIYQGFAVRDSFLTAVVNHGNLVLLGATNWGNLNLQIRPRVSSDAALATLAAHRSPFSLTQDARGPRLLILPTESGADPRGVVIGQGYRYRLVWALRPTVDGQTGNWEGLVDAQSGELLSFLDQSKYATPRRVVGGVFPVSNDGSIPNGVEQPGYPMPYTNLSTSLGATFADSGGNLAVCVDGPITTSLRGRYAAIDDVWSGLRFVYRIVDRPHVANVARAARAAKR